jgi:hypothetical protein
MHLISANQTTFAFRPHADPVLRVRPGETVRFETSATPVERLFAAGQRWLETLDVRGLNAITGPVFIEGVQPGDAVSVEILAIELLDWAWSAAIPKFGLLDGLLPGPMLERLPIRGHALGRQLRPDPDRPRRHGPLPGPGSWRALLPRRSARGHGRARGHFRRHRVRGHGDRAPRDTPRPPSGIPTHRNRRPRHPPRPKPVRRLRRGSPPGCASPVRAADP